MSDLWAVAPVKARWTVAALLQAPSMHRHIWIYTHTSICTMLGVNFFLGGLEQIQVLLPPEDRSPLWNSSGHCYFNFAPFSFALTLEMQPALLLISQLSKHQPKRVKWPPNAVTLVCFGRTTSVIIGILVIYLELVENTSRIGIICPPCREEKYERHATITCHQWEDAIGFLKLKKLCQHKPQAIDRNTVYKLVIKEKNKIKSW